MEVSARPKFCPECGARLGSDDRFCGGCGAVVVENGVTPVPPSAPAGEQAAKAVPRAARSRRGDEASGPAVFDSIAFTAALTLGSMWVLLNLRRGSLRRGWIALVGAVPAAVLVWGWLSTVAHALRDPYYAAFDRTDLQGLVVVALLARLALTVPVALEAGQRPARRPTNATTLRNVGLAGLAAALLGVALDRGSYDARRRAAVDALKGDVRVAVAYAGRDRADPSRGLWKVAITGPSVNAALPLWFYVTDAAHPAPGFDAAQATPLPGEGPNLSTYLGNGRLSFAASGPHPRYEMSVDGQTVASGDLQAAAGLP